MDKLGRHKHGHRNFEQHYKSAKPNTNLIQHSIQQWQNKNYSQVHMTDSSRQII